MREGEATAMPAAPSPPPWVALPLVAPFLDAASLAAASCVSTSWHAAFAADYLWARLCRSHYPAALGLLRQLPDSDGAASDRQCSSSPHRLLFALFRSASSRSRALPSPRLALADVAFAVDIFTAGGKNILSFAVSADEAGDVKNADGLFLFGVDLSDRNAVIGSGDWRVMWTAVRTAHRGIAPAAVLMMDAKVPAARAAGAIRFGGRGDAGVAARLPAPGCGGARLEAEVVVELTGEEKLVEKVSQLKRGSHLRETFLAKALSILSENNIRMLWPTPSGVKISALLTKLKVC
ncbi:probable F-box protein At5g04010 isoform X2 [Phragmites australis]|uniref:probable F-box protein At5g04010 isoform X2 n=1 Tax=Phragmites australis TaxID=29695 RepID=UPI002D77C969|nr:probable F-box protein At5g04010 isoform X2 [Phragmites australis]XP_062223916.1 probable F-box protein At5g04010 isoform X2 [Phragmites australis]